MRDKQKVMVKTKYSNCKTYFLTCNELNLLKALYEGLKRAQRSRLEDQRGTEINFEMPDFLKVSLINIIFSNYFPKKNNHLFVCFHQDKENDSLDTNKKQRKSLRLSDKKGACKETACFYTSQNDGDFKRPKPMTETRTKIVGHLPPPLPPKPKNLINNQLIKKKTDGKVKKPIYLDHPTSSFV